MKINEMTIRIYKDPILGYANRLQISYNNGSHIIMDDPDSSTLDDRLWCLKVDDKNGKNIHQMMNTITEAVLSMINDEDILE